MLHPATSRQPIGPDELVRRRAASATETPRQRDSLVPARRHRTSRPCELTRRRVPNWPVHPAVRRQYSAGFSLASSPTTKHQDVASGSGREGAPASPYQVRRAWYTLRDVKSRSSDKVNLHGGLTSADVPPWKPWMRQGRVSTSRSTSEVLLRLALSGRHPARPLVVARRQKHSMRRDIHYCKFFVRAPPRTRAWRLCRKS